MIGTVSINETKFSLVQYQTVNNFTIVPGNSCSASQSLQPNNVSFDLKASEKSKNILIYKNSNGNVVSYVSKYEDQIDKDNENSMPYVRYSGNYFKLVCSLKLYNLIRIFWKLTNAC